MTDEPCPFGSHGINERIGAITEPIQYRPQVEQLPRIVVIPEGFQVDEILRMVGRGTIMGEIELKECEPGPDELVNDQVEIPPILETIEPVGINDQRTLLPALETDISEHRLT